MPSEDGTLTITIPIGQPVQPLPEGDRYLGFVFAEGQDYQQAEHLKALGPNDHVTPAGS